MEPKDQEIIIAELLIKLTAIERLLVRSGALTSENIISEMKQISTDIMKVVKQKLDENAHK